MGKIAEFINESFEALEKAHKEHQERFALDLAAIEEIRLWDEASQVVRDFTDRMQTALKEAIEQDNSEYERIHTRLAFAEKLVLAGLEDHVQIDGGLLL